MWLYVSMQLMPQYNLKKCHKGKYLNRDISFSNCSQKYFLLDGPGLYKSVYIGTVIEIANTIRANSEIPKISLWREFKAE